MESNEEVSFVIAWKKFIKYLLGIHSTVVNIWVIWSLAHMPLYMNGVISYYLNAQYLFARMKICGNIYNN